MNHIRSIAVVATLVSGCGGGGSTDIEGTLVFAELGDTEIARVVNASGGTDMFMAQAQVDQFGDTFEEDPCPTITIDGNVATVTGGCTTADGVEIGGTASVTNPFGWDQIESDYGDDTTYDLDISFTQSGFTQSYQGLIFRNGEFTTWDADITTDSFDLAVRSDIYYHCSGSASSVTCKVSGSGIELIGIGGATLSGTIRASEADSSSDFTLRGVDTLEVSVTTGCVYWEVLGTDRTSPTATCPQ